MSATLNVSTPTERELVMTRVFPSQEVRDMLIKSGMTSGAAETYDKLAACLASMV
jgi:hypothetical protein